MRVTSRVQRGRLVADLPAHNPWWTPPLSRWVATDPQLTDAAQAPFEYRPPLLDDVTPPNLYTLRGPRRAGKSTVLKQTVGRLCREGIDPRRICYFSAEALSTYQDLITFFQAARSLFPDLGDTPRFFLIDEVTSIPDWQRGVKWVRDNTAARGDCIVATGSSARDVAAGTTYLAGRRGPDVGLDRLLLPLSFSEFVRCAGYPAPPAPRIDFRELTSVPGRHVIQDALVHLGTLGDAFEAYLLVGGFPQAVADFRRTAQVSDGFARDLWDVTRSDLQGLGVSRPEQALRLLERIAAGLTSTISLTSLGEALNVSYQTAGSWLDTLADAFLVLLLYQESGGLADIRKQRKVYPIDPFLARLPARLAPNLLEPESSKLAEAAVVAAVSRAVEATALDRLGQPGRIFLFRTRDGAEVDLVVHPGARAIEVKYVDAVTARDYRSLVTHFGGGHILTRTAFDFEGSVTVAPAPLFLWLLNQSG